MVKVVKITTLLDGTIELVKLEDYLEVEGEKDNLKECLTNLQIQDENKFHELVKYEKILKEKDEEIDRLKEENYHLKCEITHLTDEPLKVKKEELWTLRYVFENSITLKEKEVVQYHMLKEDAEELIGMDSDNWNKYSLEKE